MSSTGLFAQALLRKNSARPPVWFMRQAGRYHSHYQKLRQRYSFVELCKNPEIACEAALGPVQDFGFDAAILFSDLLFPLEVMGMGLTYENGGPELAWHLQSPQDLSRLKSGAELATELSFQGKALELTRAKLPLETGLLGFVGGPLTLFFYAAAGSHKGDLSKAHEGLHRGIYFEFVEKLLDLLAHNMANQARSGADTIAILDTCGGELTPTQFKSLAVPPLEALIKKFHSLCPGFPVAYYSKGTSSHHWRHLSDTPIAYLGIDWNQNLAKTLDEFGERWAIQGNLDPHWLFLEPPELEKRTRAVFEEVLSLPIKKRMGWICGLGHGVLPKTPEENIRRVLRIQKEMFLS